MTQYYVRKFLDSDEAAEFAAELVEKGIPAEHIRVLEKRMQYYKFSSEKYLTTIVKWRAEIHF